MKTLRKTILGLILVLCVAMTGGLLSACGSESSEKLCITLKQNEVTVEVGQVVMVGYETTPKKVLVEASSENEDVFKHEVRDGIVTIEGVAEGTQELTITAYKDGERDVATLTVTVVAKSNETPGDVDEIPDDKEPNGEEKIDPSEEEKDKGGKYTEADLNFSLSVVGVGDSCDNETQIITLTNNGKKKSLLVTYNPPNETELVCKASIKTEDNFFALGEIMSMIDLSRVSGFNIAEVSEFELVFELQILESGELAQTLTITYTVRVV